MINCHPEAIKIKARKGLWIIHLIGIIVGVIVASSMLSDISEDPYNPLSAIGIVIALGLGLITYIAFLIVYYILYFRAKKKHTTLCATNPENYVYGAKEKRKEYFKRNAQRTLVNTVFKRIL